MSTSTKRLIFLVIAIGVILLACAFWFTHQPKPSEITGTSQIKALDIVSGDIHTSDQSSIIQYINTETGSSISGNDLAIREDTYKKTFDQTDANYMVTFTADIASLQASYDVTIYYNSGVFGPMTIACSTQQKAGYACNYHPREYVVGDGGN